jgi:hypothetical protein
MTLLLSELKKKIALFLLQLHHRLKKPSPPVFPLIEQNTREMFELAQNRKKSMP